MARETDMTDYYKRMEAKVEEGRKLWFYKIAPYKKPIESESQFIKRCGLSDRGVWGRWFLEGRKPHLATAKRVLDNLQIPEAEAKEILTGLTGVSIDESSAATQEGYIYPDSDGVESATGRLGFKSVFLETSGVKPQSVKMAICDTQSMMPEIRPRDMMLIDMSKTTPTGGKTYLIETEDGQILCELYPVPGKKFSVIFKNNDVYPNYQIPQEEVVIHGEVVFIGRLL